MTFVIVCFVSAHWYSQAYRAAEQHSTEWQRDTQHAQQAHLGNDCKSSQDQP